MIITIARGQGLSPRGRGKHSNPQSATIRKRSIPAWAGETPALRAVVGGFAVYPRVGGGNHSQQDGIGGGGGLSPRGRGKRQVCPPYRAIGGSIPAWAGETQTGVSVEARRGVYPRVGGGNGPGTAEQRRNAGLSPRGRGKRVVIMAHRDELRSIPAWAGETSGGKTDKWACRVYPRVGGGNGVAFAEHWIAPGLSPRGRGKLDGFGGGLAGLRSIPAWAGETRKFGGRG